MEIFSQTPKWNLWNNLCWKMPGSSIYIHTLYHIPALFLCYDLGLEWPLKIFKGGECLDHGLAGPSGNSPTNQFSSWLCCLKCGICSEMCSLWVWTARVYFRLLSSLSVSWPPWYEQLPSATPFHDVISALESADWRLKTWAEINLSSFRVQVWGWERYWATLWVLIKIVTQLSLLHS